MSVSEYVAKFESLAWFSRYLSDNPHDDWKAIKFEQGLKSKLQSSFGILEIRAYPTLVNVSGSRIEDASADSIEA